MDFALPASFLYHGKYLHIYVDGNIRNPALPVMPRHYQKFFINKDL